MRIIGALAQAFLVIAGLSFILGAPTTGSRFLLRGVTLALIGPALLCLALGLLVEASASPELSSILDTVLAGLPLVLKILLLVLIPVALIRFTNRRRRVARWLGDKKTSRKRRIERF